jgi:protein-L-isoaspartate(D-aspartate) O-methyltransferase
MAIDPDFGGRRLMKLQVFPMAILIVSTFATLFAGIGSCGEKKAAAPVNGEDRYLPLRQRMVEHQIRARGVRDPLVLGAMLKVPRHEYVPSQMVSRAYDDRPLPIGLGQTISQPYIVALMTELLRPEKGQKILEVGTGSGYQAAVLAEIVGHVYTIEIVEPLAQEAEQRLGKLGYDNVSVRAGDGYRGWPEEAPFDGIIVTAAPDHIPQPLIDQLKVGARLVIPVGESIQDLVLITRTETGTVKENITGVRFVHMTGEAELSHEN